MIPALPFVLLFLRSQICNLKKAQICDERLESRAVAIGRKMAISLSEMERFKPGRVQRQLVGATVCLVIGANLQVWARLRAMAGICARWRLVTSPISSHLERKAAVRDG